MHLQTDDRLEFEVLFKKVKDSSHVILNQML